MSRKEMIEKGHAKTIKAWKKMMSSRNPNYISQKVRISHKLTLDIRCERTKVEFLIDEQGNRIQYGRKGHPYAFQIYAIVNGKEVDCTSDHESMEDDIWYLIRCYA